MIHTTVRTARRTHICSRCGGRIKVGQRYASHVASPNDNEVNSGNPRWWRIAECATCCEICKRPIEEAK